MPQDAACSNCYAEILKILHQANNQQEILESGAQHNEQADIRESSRVSEDEKTDSDKANSE